AKAARVVFDPVGGTTVNKLVQATDRAGIVFLYCAFSTEPAPLPLFDVLSNWVRIPGYVLMEIASDPEALQMSTEFVESRLADDSVQPLVARTLPLEQIAEAHRFLESNQQIGKVVVTV